MSEHRRALDAVTGIPASAGFCEPVEGYADSPMSIVSTVRVMASEVERLTQELEQVQAEIKQLKQANFMKGDLAIEWKVKLDKAQARVAELLRAGNGLCHELESWTVTEHDRESQKAMDAWKRLRQQADEAGRAGGEK